jgi:DinB superfamily
MLMAPSGGPTTGPVFPGGEEASMNPGCDPRLKKEVLELIRAPHAHLPFEEAVAGIPPDRRGIRPPGMPHSAWELLEHLRISLEDIVVYCHDPKYVSPKWPEGYWPKGAAPPDEGAWDRSVAAFLRSREEMETWIGDPDRDLLGAVPNPKGPTLLHEVVIAAAHASYHLGQILLVRRALGS